MADKGFCIDMLNWRVMPTEPAWPTECTHGKPLTTTCDDCDLVIDALYRSGTAV